MITQEYLQSLLDYNPETGLFVWKISYSPRTKIGIVAGSLNKDGYIHIQLNKKKYKAHRLAWIYIYGKLPNEYIDHINGNKADNRLCNLREATKNNNQWNSKIRKDNTSGIKGVVWNKHHKKWFARLKFNGITKNIGYFDILEEAKNAINEARNKYHKEFASHE